MKNYIAIYDTEAYKNIKYSFMAASIEAAARWASNFFTVPVKAIIETDEFANPI